MIKIHWKRSRYKSSPCHSSKRSQLVKKQTTRNHYRHPNYKTHFDQRQGQNEHKQRSDDFRKERTQNQQTKQKKRSSIRQSDRQIAPIKIDLGWKTSQTMQHLFLGIRNTYRLVSLSVIITNTKIKGWHYKLNKIHA